MNVVKKATHHGELQLGDVSLPCFVLEDGQRLISKRGMAEGLGSINARGNTLAAITRSKSLNPFIGQDLMMAVKNPIEFDDPWGHVAHGYPSDVLMELCNAVLECRRAGQLHHKQEDIARQCEILVLATSKVGILALIDEATGYQAVRDEDSLAEALQQLGEQLASRDRIIEQQSSFPTRLLERMADQLDELLQQSSLKDELIGKLLDHVEPTRTAVEKPAPPKPPAPVKREIEAPADASQTDSISEELWEAILLAKLTQTQKMVMRYLMNLIEENPWEYTRIRNQPVADALGLRKEQVSRSISRLERFNMLEVDRHSRLDRSIRVQLDIRAWKCGFRRTAVGGRR